MSPVPSLAQVASLLRTSRLPLGQEKQMQAAFADKLEAAGFVFEREKRLSPADIIDFLVDGGIGVELKLSGQRAAFVRQCERYCAHDEVKAIIFVTNRAITLPPLINGKPARAINPAEAWL